MAEFHSLSGPLPHIPDNLSIPQFFLDDHNPIRPNRPEGTPWLIHDESGLALGHAEKDAWFRKRDKLQVEHMYVQYSKKADSLVDAPHSKGRYCPANPAYKPDELVHQLRTSKAALLIIHPAFLSTARIAAREVGLADNRIIFIETPLHKLASSHLTLDQLVEYGLSVPISYSEIRFNPGEAKTTLAFLSFSSGTTGKPKAVAIAHYSVIANVVQMVTHTKLNDPSHRNKHFAPGDVAVAVLPFFHIYGLVVNLHFLLFAGLSIVVVPKFNFTAFLESIHPSVKGFDFSHVKYLMCGAAPLSGDLVEQLCHILPNAFIGQGYGEKQSIRPLAFNQHILGLTETCTTVGMLPTTQKIGTLGSAGQLLPGMVARVIKEDGSLAREGEQGELVITGPSMALGYLNNATATKETFVDGWVRTGDEVIIKNGDIFIVDRLKEILKVRGFQVAPAELEGHLLSHSDVADACVVSVPNDYSGELPLAYVVLSETAARRIAGNFGAAAQAKALLAKYVADAKAPYKHLTGGIEFIDAVPKNPSGKILRRVLRDEARKLKNHHTEIRGKL
ncbi:hypothetical protein DXG01_011889 [Tephrocybe rancida]|nr:hypothetical protein DXG01_011889 [Tephrocybe rancida]